MFVIFAARSGLVENKLKCIKTRSLWTKEVVVLIYQGFDFANLFW